MTISDDELIYFCLLRCESQDLQSFTYEEKLQLRNLLIDYSLKIWSNREKNIV